MKQINIHKKALLNTKQAHYLKYLVVIIPLLNFLTGINIDLISPSLPALAHYFQVNMHVVEESIAITMIGFGFGCMFFGTVIDSFGRRIIILAGLFGYAIASLLAIFAFNIEQILILRAIQGFMVASVSIGSRAVVADSFQGKRFTVVITYTSIAYGLGPVLAPFIGSLLQNYFNWQANFVAYMALSVLLLSLFLLLVHESIQQVKPLVMHHVLANYKKVFMHMPFIAGVLLIAMTTIEMLLYPTVGPFVIHNLYHRSVLIYGDTALIVSAGYLIGTITNRVLIKSFSKKQLISVGLSLMVVAMLLGMLLSYMMSQYLISIMLPLCLMYFGVGFIFPNVLATCLSYFANNIGPASAIQTTSLTMIGGLGIGLAGLLQINHTQTLFYILSVLVMIQLLIYGLYFKRKLTT